MIEYILISSIYLAVFYLFYHLLIRNDTNYRRNRIYLLTCILVSLILPVVKIQIGSNSIFASINNNIARIAIIEQVNVYAGDIKTGSNIINNLPFLIYVAGCFISLTAFLTSISRLLNLIKNYGIKKSRIVITPPGKESGFSALGYIFLSSDLNNQIRSTILEHEKQHIIHKHFVDILLLRFLGIFFWFNPFVYLYERSLKALHEFEADQRMLDSGQDVLRYQQLIVNKVFNTSIFTLQNGFSGRSLIKKRMIMMTKKRSTKMSGLKLLFALPVILIVFGLFSCKTEPKEPLEFIDEKDNTETVAKQVPESKTTDTLQEIQEDDVLFVVEEMPTFQGGDIDVFRNWVMKNIKYPETAVQNGIQGQVFVMFVVNKEGTVQNVVITRGVDPVLDNEAKRVVESSPRWVPGKHNGEIVPVKFSITVNFRLQ